MEPLVGSLLGGAVYKFGRVDHTGCASTDVFTNVRVSDFGCMDHKSVDPQRLKAPGFNPGACSLKSRFQSLCLSRSVCAATAGVGDGRRGGAVQVELI